MPTYEYECEACGHEFEQFQSITAAPLRKCPKCGKPKAKRLISAGGGLIFKGSGFYITDYRSDSYKKAAEAETKAATGGDKSDSGKPADSTSKPAASDGAAKSSDSAKTSVGGSGKSKPEKSAKKPAP